jgi:predicted dehydrogenase
MSTIRLGFIGAGGMGQCAHLRNYLGERDCAVVAVAELRPRLRAEVAARYAIPRAYADHREMLATEKLDGIVCIQQFEMHGQLLPEIFAAAPGVPVLTEKPIGRSIEAADTILAAAARHGSPLHIAYHKRSDPAVLHARELITTWKASGEMGAMRLVRLAMPPGDWSAQGFSTLITSDEAVPPLVRDAAPVGLDQAATDTYTAFVNYYIHQVNLLRHLYGEDYEVTYADPAGHLLATRSASGVAGTLEMAAYRTTADWQESAFVAFEKAWIRIELPAPLAIDRPGRVTVYRDDPGNGIAPYTVEPTLPAIHAMRQQARFFLKALRGEATPLCGPDEARRDLAAARRWFDLVTIAKAGAQKTAAARA